MVLMKVKKSTKYIVDDKNHLIDAYHAACDVAKDYHWYEVNCVKDNTIRTIEEIHEEIYNEIKKHI